MKLGSGRMREREWVTRLETWKWKNERESG